MWLGAVEMCLEPQVHLYLPSAVGIKYCLDASAALIQLVSGFIACRSLSEGLGAENNRLSLLRLELGTFCPPVRS
jgi:hypothetical protein